MDPLLAVYGLGLLVVAAAGVSAVWTRRRRQTSGPSTDAGTDRAGTPGLVGGDTRAGGVDGSP